MSSSFTVFAVRVQLLLLFITVFVIFFILAQNSDWTYELCDEIEQLLESFTYCD